MQDENVTPNGGSDDSVMRAIRNLPRSIEPQRDLWAQIAPALDRPGAHRRPALQLGWTYALAAAIGCVALGALLTYGVMRQKVSTPVLDTATARLPTNSEAAATIRHASFGDYAALGPEYEQARANLIIGLVERLDRLPPLERLKVERNLRQIRDALGEINAALALEPDNTLLRELLLNTYQDELTLLANVNQMAETIPVRTES